MNNNISSIIPGLWLGSSKAIAPKCLREHDISVVISCTAFPEAINRWNGTRHWISMFDSEAEANGNDYMNKIYSALGIIKHSLDNHREILVHCDEGRSRSASIVLAFLLVETSMDFPSSLEFLSKKRFIEIHPAFLSKIKTLK
jgi:hypothetical protein